MGGLQKDLSPVKWVEPKDVSLETFSREPEFGVSRKQRTWCAVV